jgi:SsrA-binding protein
MSDAEKHITANRKARHDYHIEDALEAGIVLQGTEVKALRAGKVNLQDAFCTVQNGELFLYQCHIAPYDFGNRFNHDPMRPRKLLMHHREIERWRKATQQQGYTLVPLRMYFRNGFAKVEVGLARGKKHYDKREDLAERDTKRRLDRVRKGSRDED